MEFIFPIFLCFVMEIIKESLKQYNSALDVRGGAFDVREAYIDLVYDNGALFPHIEEIYGENFDVNDAHIHIHIRLCCCYIRAISDVDPAAGLVKKSKLDIVF